MKKVTVERLTVVLIIVLCAFSSWVFISRAGIFDDGMIGQGGGQPGDGNRAEIYYFNNAVNTSPEELGNYWYDSRLSEQAQELPDFSSPNIQVTVTSESIFDGDIIFNGEAVNYGTVNGNAIFTDDLSENSGIINGTVTRRYSLTTSTTRDFTGDYTWTIVTDGIILDVTAATYDENTVFIHENGGSFISNMATVSETVNDKNLVLQYDRTLNSESVPAVEDFVVVANGEIVDVTNVSILEDRLTLNLVNSVPSGDQVYVSYTLGNNLILSMQGLNALALKELEVSNVNPADEETIDDSPVIQESVPARGGSTFLFSVRPIATDEKSIISEKDKQSKEKKEAVEPLTKIDSKEDKAANSEVAHSPRIEEVKLQDTPTISSEIVEKLKTPLLLAVEDKGKIWYVAPTNGQRYEVSQSNALNLFRSVALGITNKDLSQIPLANSEAKQTKIGNRLEGRFLLQVESRGESWFVQDGFRYRVNGNNLVEVTKKSVGGIKNQVLEKIPVASQ